jgi:hypothetical protein
MVAIWVLGAGAPAARAGAAECKDGFFSFDSLSSQVNRVVVLSNLRAGVLTATDAVPIRNDGGVQYPNPADRRTVRCRSRSFDVDIDLGPGDDTLRIRHLGRPCEDIHLITIHDGPGDDRVALDVGNPDWFNGPGDDTYRGGRCRDIAKPGAGDDRVYGGAGNDGLSGGAGNDLLVGGPGLDSVFGGPGIDRIDGVIRESHRG